MKHFNIDILDVIEGQDIRLLTYKIYIFVIKITRNDGLEWIIKKRYSEVRELRETLLTENPDVSLYRF